MTPWGEDKRNYTFGTSPLPCALLLAESNLYSLAGINYNYDYDIFQ